jgi:hypothetical protein
MYLDFLCDRWVLRCHACSKVTQEVGKIFCPKCGNGGTLRKVSVTVGENGITMASRRPRITLRGTKVSVVAQLLCCLSSMWPRLPVLKSCSVVQ